VIGCCALSISLYSIYRSARYDMRHLSHEAELAEINRAMSLHRWECYVPNDHSITVYGRVGEQRRVIAGPLRIQDSKSGEIVFISIRPAMVGQNFDHAEQLSIVLQHGGSSMYTCENVVKGAKRIQFAPPGLPPSMRRQDLVTGEFGPSHVVCIEVAIEPL
jgi:hypothetical protein